jgi:nucleotide-binding universal stress UspA family protein
MADRAGAPSVTTRSANGDAATGIISAAQATGPDLVVLGRRGLSGIAELFLGSVSQKVLHQARVDVLTVA